MEHGRSWLWLAALLLLPAISHDGLTLGARIALAVTAVTIVGVVAGRLVVRTLRDYRRRCAENRDRFEREIRAVLSSSKRR